MTERTDLELTVRNMVAYDILSKPLVSLGHKADRRRDKLAGEAASLVRKKREYERFVAYTEIREEEERARTMRDGINAFSKEYPDYGSILEGMIQEMRAVSNKYLVYRIKEGFKLGAEDYRRVMKDLGMETRQADAMYPHLLDISERLGKAKETEKRNILL